MPVYYLNMKRVTQSVFSLLRQRRTRPRRAAASMTEFWKSGARHWCTYCKLFINGTKPSIAYHENGKKHKEIAELYLKEMRVRAREKGKDKKELEGELAKIERAALKQYQRDDVAGSSEARRPRDPDAGDRASRLAALEVWPHGRSLLVARRSSEWAAWRGQPGAEVTERHP